MNTTRKNIVLVTWQGAGNYGTSLQSYALHEKIKQLGYNISYLKPFNMNTILKNDIKWLLSIVGLLRLKEKIEFYKTLKNRKIYNFRNQKYNNKQIFTHWQYKMLLKRTDVFITGSDQIWNTHVRYNPFMFLDFAGNVKRIAYASSIGTFDIAFEYREKVKKHLQQFQHIGVREESAVSVLTKLVERQDIIQVLDPTFLLTKRDWSKLANEAILEIALPKQYILCYLIGTNSWYESQLKEIKGKTQISQIIIVSSQENSSFTFPEAQIYKDGGPIEFVQLIRHATLVCTDSFHATALSINFSINFVELMRFKDNNKESQNSRIYDILEHYQLQSHIYSEQSNEWNKPIDFTPIQQILERDRESSLNYLISSIEN